MIGKLMNRDRLLCSVMVFAMMLSMLLVPQRAQAFDITSPPMPGAADGWYEIKGGKYSGENVLWNWTNEYLFNDTGQMIQQTTENSEGSKSTKQYEYDSEGRVSRITSDDSERQKNYQYVYDYKEDGSIVTTESWEYENYDQSGWETQTHIRTYSPFDGWWYNGEWKFEYDAKGRLIHRWSDTYSPQDWTCAYEEDAQGRIVKGVVKDNGYEYERLYSYPENGGYTMREDYGTSYEEFTYNAGGQLTQFGFSDGEERYVFDYIYDEAGNNTRIQTEFGSEAYWAFEYKKLPEEGEDNPPVQFEDVSDKAYYAEAVKWAVEKGVTNGLDEKHFGPDKNCTRDQIVTFLWRAAGQPEPTLTENPFTDVSPDAFYYKAVLWAVENKITSGTSDTTFGPKDPCTRGQVATFLYRTQGSPKTAAENPFSDLEPGGFYYKAVLWAVSSGVTNGTTPTTFSPGAACTRGQIVTFLYRALAD